MNIDSKDMDTNSNNIIINNNTAGARSKKYEFYDNLSFSHLILHNNDASIYQSFDINMDYLILYEAVNPKGDRSTYQEFAQNSKILTGGSYGALMKQGRRLHYHNFYELTFVLSGTLNMLIEDEYLSLHEGDCCLCNKNIHHLEIMDQNTEIILFLLKEEFVQTLLEDNYYLSQNGVRHGFNSLFDIFFTENGKHPLTDAKIYAFYELIKKDSHDSMIEITNQMISELTESHSGKNFMLKALFCRFFEYLEDNHVYNQSTHWAKLSHEEEIIEKIMQSYQYKDGVFSRSEIESITGYHSDYIERIVKKNTGKTLSELGRELLLKKATYLLMQRNQTVSSICSQLGYSNRNYFNKIFLRQYGMLPSEYRRKYGRP